MKISLAAIALTTFQAALTNASILTVTTPDECRTTADLSALSGIIDSVLATEDVVYDKRNGGRLLEVVEEEQHGRKLCYDRATCFSASGGDYICNPGQSFCIAVCSGCRRTLRRELNSSASLDATKKSMIELDMKQAIKNNFAPSAQCGSSTKVKVEWKS